MSILTSGASMPSTMGIAIAPHDSEGAPLKEKRRRTGKPKVRTGCVTWIRRIKCDEQKPACRRCISTGRTCDGYMPVTKEPGKVNSVVRQREVFPKKRLLPSTQPTLLRPLVADFAGDMVERQYIHRWLSIAEDAVGIRERANGLFWERIVPEYVTIFPGIRHAVVALSAAHHNFQTNGVRRDFSGPPTKLECFIISQYNKALEMVREQVDNTQTPQIKRFGFVIMACVLFFYTEILLSQWPAAMMHILNGLKVMTHTPVEIHDVYSRPENWKKVSDNTMARATYMVRLLCRWEVTAGFMASKNRPSMSIGTWKPLEQQTCSVPAQVQSLDHLCEIVNVFFQDVCAFIWICNNNEKEDEPWDGTTFKLQYHILQQRACLIAGLLERSQDTYGDLTKVAKTSEYILYLSRCLHQRSAALCLDLIIMPQGPSYPLPIDEDLRSEELITLVVLIRDILQTSLGPAVTPWFNVDFGVISALYLVATNCCNVKTRRRLYALIRDWPWQENLWDGPLLRERLLKEESIETQPNSPETQLVYR